VSQKGVRPNMKNELKTKRGTNKGNLKKKKKNKGTKRFASVVQRETKSRWGDRRKISKEEDKGTEKKGLIRERRRKQTKQRNL